MANSQRVLLRHCALALAIVAIICIVNVSAASNTYLSPTGTPVWDGNCDSGCANAAEPCGLPSTAISATSPSQNCVLNFLAGNYTSPVSINQAQDATKLTASFATDSGGVQGIALSIKAQTVTITGKVSFGTVSVSLEATDKVQFKDLTSTASTFNFVGSSAPSMVSDISVASSTFSYVPSVLLPSGKDIVYLFNFKVPGAASSSTKKLPTFTIDNSTVQLSADLSGLVFSAGGSGPSTVAIKQSQVTTPFALVTFNETTATKLRITSSTIISAEKIFKSLRGIDASNFDSSVAPLALVISSSTVTGRSTGLLTQVYDPNACVNLDFFNSSVSFLDMNCNSPNSLATKDRCSYEFASSTLTDNRICIFGVHYSPIPMLETKFIVSANPTRAPVMTWLRNVEIEQALGTVFKAIAQTPTGSSALKAGNTGSSLAPPSLESTPFLFSGRVAFDTLAEVWFNRFTLDVGAKLDVPEATFSEAVIKMRNASSITSTDSRTQYLFDGHCDFSMDSPGNATIRIDSAVSPRIQINVDRWTILNTLPVVQVSQGIIFIAPYPQYFLSSYLTVNWGTNRTLSLHPSNKAYPLISNAVFSTIDSRFRYAVANSLGGYNFTAWVTPYAHYCDQHVCSDVTFGDARYFPARDNTPVPPPLNVMPTAPPKAAAPKSGTSHCYGGQTLYSNFACVNGAWYHQGNLTLDERIFVVIDSSPVYVNGDINFAAGGFLTLAGEHAGIQLSGCFNSPKEPVVTLDYSAGWPNKERWYQEAIVQSPRCKADRHHIPYDIVTPGGCKSWQSGAAAYMTNGLYINWTLNSSGCANVLAIGLGVGFGVLALIVAGVLIFVCVRRRRAAAAERKERLGGFTSDYEPLVNEGRGL